MEKVKYYYDMQPRAQYRLYRYTDDRIYLYSPKQLNANGGWWQRPTDVLQLINAIPISEARANIIIKLGLEQDQE